MDLVHKLTKAIYSYIENFPDKGEGFPVYVFKTTGNLTYMFDRV